MKFTEVTTIPVELTNEEREALTLAYNILTELHTKMIKTGKTNAVYMTYDGTEYLANEEIDNAIFVLGSVMDIDYLE